ncbi:hypothetical protein [Mesorhizobium sp. M00.F.Ca.ET.216.01.1.1]|uniref:hypothetical protein n=1 Tax=Mesorhizobium sp. M00.F.Ca.ET.216.01.1.1 TaxID=2500528 RepID=UPI000FDC79EC|nr:hypothetical protein [Mesorhizobium sp. M00.F.Ca.ET.216.01.1.1]TGQ33380.1 hypothetical protein EN859_026755 [Mesorhizobium sp. M00.F.Ca.ET.216.01.1.1]
MNIKSICFGALALCLLGSSAFAGALDEPSNMQPFFTDASMKEMKPMPEFKAVFMAMPKEKRDALMGECNDAAMSKPYARFCENLNALAGHN